MGESEPIVTLRDMYDVMVGTRDDVQRLTVLMSGAVARLDDHEARLRRLEERQADYVTEDDVRESSGHSLLRIGTIGGVVATVISVSEFLILHH